MTPETKQKVVEALTIGLATVRERIMYFGNYGFFSNKHMFELREIKIEAALEKLEKEEQQP